MTQTLEPLLGSHPFFARLASPYLALVVDCATNVEFDDGEYLFREGTRSDLFFLLREGALALEVTALSGTEPVTVQTLGPGDIAGFSWLTPPHRGRCAGRAVGRGGAVELDGARLRDKCEEDPRLGYELMRQFAALASTRLQATRLQLLDGYGLAGTPSGR